MNTTSFLEINRQCSCIEFLPAHSSSKIFAPSLREPKANTEFVGQNFCYPWVKARRRFPEIYCNIKCFSSRAFQQLALGILDLVMQASKGVINRPAVIILNKPIWDACVLKARAVQVFIMVFSSSLLRFVCRGVRAGSCHPVPVDTIRCLPGTKSRSCVYRFQSFLAEPSPVRAQFCWHRWRSADRGRGDPVRG